MLKKLQITRLTTDKKNIKVKFLSHRFITKFFDSDHFETLNKVIDNEDKGN